MEEVTLKVASGRKVEEDNSYLYLVRIRNAILSGISRFCRLQSRSCRFGAEVRCTKYLSHQTADEE